MPWSTTTPTIEARCIDIMRLPTGYAAGCDLTYTDPPWGAGLLKMFETWAHKQAGLPRPGNSIRDVLTRLFGLVPHGRPCFVEYSVKGHEDVLSIAESCGLSGGRVHHAIQTNGKPYVILSFNSDIDFGGKPNGWESIRRVVAHHKPKLVFDPFAGIGQTAHRFATAGVSVMASELNPARAARLMGVAEKWKQ